MYNEYKEISEELLEELSKYKGTLSTNNYRYLESLIKLERSIVNDGVDVMDKTELKKCPIFSRIAVYNFYNRPMRLLNEFKNELEDKTDEQLDINCINTSCGRYPMFSVSIKLSDREFRLLDIYYANSDRFGKKWLADLHRVNTINNITDLLNVDDYSFTKNDLLQVELTNCIYKLLMKDFGIADRGNINTKNNVYSCFNISTCLNNLDYSNNDVKTRALK